MIKQKGSKISLYAIRFIGVNNRNRIPSNRNISQIKLQHKFDVESITKIEINGVGLTL